MKTHKHFYLKKESNKECYLGQEYLPGKCQYYHTLNRPLGLNVINYIFTLHLTWSIVNNIEICLVTTTGKNIQLK